MTQPPYPPQPVPAPGGSRAKKIAIIVGAVLLVGGIVLVVMMNRGGGPPPGLAAPAGPAAAGPAFPPAAKVPPTPEVSVSADEMVRKYTDDEEGARTAYLGKVVEVTGTVSDRRQDVLGGYFVALAGGVERVRGVQCTLHAENVPQFAAIEKGQAVTIRGWCNDLKGNVELKDCAVMELKPGEP